MHNGLHELLSYIEQYGYWALFFCLWLGLSVCQFQMK